jgi:hypothetical protein
MPLPGGGTLRSHHCAPTIPPPISTIARRSRLEERDALRHSDPTRLRQPSASASNQAEF